MAVHLHFLGGVAIGSSVESEAWDSERGNDLEQLTQRWERVSAGSHLPNYWELLLRGCIYSGRDAEDAMLVYGKPN